MKNDFKNQEGYTDPTPGTAIKNMRKKAEEKMNAADAERMDLALSLAKIILENAGFKVMERIVLKNKRTGKIFR